MAKNCTTTAFSHCIGSIWRNLIAMRTRLTSNITAFGSAVPAALRRVFRIVYRLLPRPPIGPMRDWARQSWMVCECESKRPALSISACRAIDIMVGDDGFRVRRLPIRP